VVIESSIPKEFILGYQIFCLPSFNADWSDSILKRYGLSNEVYNSYRKRLRNDWNNRTTILEDIVVIVTKYQAQQMIALVKANADKYGRDENKVSKEKKLNLTSTGSHIAKSG
jgi:hypothetical protein